MKPEPKFAVGDRVVSRVYGPGRVLLRWWQGIVPATWVYRVGFGQYAGVNLDHDDFDESGLLPASAVDRLANIVRKLP